MAFADPGVGRKVIQAPPPSGAIVLLAQACEEGDILGYSSGWKLALATVGSVINPQVPDLTYRAFSAAVQPYIRQCVASAFTRDKCGMSLPRMVAVTRAIKFEAQLAHGSKRMKWRLELYGGN